MGSTLLTERVREKLQGTVRRGDAVSDFLFQFLKGDPVLLAELRREAFALGNKAFLKQCGVAVKEEANVQEKKLPLGPEARFKPPPSRIATTRPVRPSPAAKSSGSPRSQPPSQPLAPKPGDRPPSQYPTLNIAHGAGSGKRPRPVTATRPSSGPQPKQRKQGQAIKPVIPSSQKPEPTVSPKPSWAALPTPHTVTTVVSASDGGKHNPETVVDSRQALRIQSQSYDRYCEQRGIPRTQIRVVRPTIFPGGAPGLGKKS